MWELSLPPEAQTLSDCAQARQFNRRQRALQINLEGDPAETDMVAQPILNSLPVPTADERSMGLLAHLLQIFTGFIGPVVILVLKPNSAFIKFHALQSLIMQLCYTALIVAGMIIFFSSIFAAAVLSGTRHTEPPASLILVIPFFWLMLFASWIANVILAVVYGLKANHGEWAAYPIIGKWCLPKLAR